MTGKVKTIALGLQGGGSHTAFTWGVLDVLLDLVASGQLEIKAISGTSGGALSAAVCTYGLITSPVRAKALLQQFWMSVANESLWPRDDPFFGVLSPRDPRRWNVDKSPLAVGIGIASQIWSPYWNPLGNLEVLLGPILQRVIADFAVLAAPDVVPKLYVSATAVDRTALRIFGPGEISLKALLASACLPTYFEAIKIDGVAYWDGGYMANPAMNPLVDAADDLLTVLIDPLDVSGGAPTTPDHIMDRVNGVSFGASWVLEMRRIELINNLIRRGDLAPGRYKEKRFHVVRDDKFMEEIGASSKMVPNRDFLDALRQRGRRTAELWIEKNFQRIGEKSTFDVEREINFRVPGTGRAEIQNRHPG